MSSSRNSSASSSRSKSRSADKSSKKGKGKSIIKRTIEKIRKASESNHSDEEVAGPSGTIDALPNIENWEMDPELEGDQNSDNEQIAPIERGRARNREGAMSSASGSSASGPNAAQAKYLAYTQANPLGRILLNMASDNLALQERAGITESSVNAGELCSAFFHQMEMERKMVQKELTKVAEKTEERIMSREFDALCVNGVENMPPYFSKRPKLISNSARVEATRIFPVKKQFSGNSNNEITICEFFNTMKDAQSQMRLTETEFTLMLLRCTAGRAHELIQQWVDQEEGLTNIYFNLTLQYDRRMTPEAARNKLATLMAAKNVDLPRHISNVMTLADRASFALPQGATRNAYYNNEAIQALIRSLPPTSRTTCSNLFHTLSAKARRAITFMELSRPLNTLRHTIDLDIKQNGANVVNNNSKTSSSKSKKGYKKNYSSYSVDTVLEDKTVQQDKQRQVQGSQGNQAAVYQANAHQDKAAKGNSGFRGNSGNKRQHGSNNQSKGASNTSGTRRYCSLCGKTNHTAAQGCRNMKDNSGQIIEIQPAQSTCNVCPATVIPRLNHPPYLCPFRPTGPFHSKK